MLIQREEAPQPTRPTDTTGFDRDRVTEIQRARLLAAMADVCAAHGAANVTVGYVVQRAGVSRRTFYEVFADIGDCLTSAFDHAAERAAQRISGAYERQSPWVQRIRTALIAFLSFVDEEPAMGRLLIVESLAAGPEVLQRRQRALAPAIAAVDEGREQAANGREPPPLTAEGIVGGALALLHARLCEQREASLLDLAGSLMSMIALPYLGPAAAKREGARPVPKPPPPEQGASPISLGELQMRLTYRTVRVLGALASNPGSSNKRVADTAGVNDQGQMSKLLGRLHQLGLIENNNSCTPPRGEPNSWTLTSKGWQIHSALTQQTG
jgi:AcrR family transcriptional regulator